MDQLTNAELFDLSLSLATSFANEFQYWLSATFAVIVATFIVGDRLTKPMRIWVALLYVCVSALYAARYLWFSGFSGDVGEEFLARGMDPGELGSLFSAGTRVVVFVFGIITTIWFISRNRMSHQGE